MNKNKIIETAIFSIFGMAAIIGRAFAVMDAIEREANFNQERLCDYWSKEVNRNAAEKGKPPPC